MRFTVCSRGITVIHLECLSKIIIIRYSAFLCNHLNRHFCVRKQFAGLIQSAFFDIFGRRIIEKFSENCIELIAGQTKYGTQFLY